MNKTNTIGIRISDLLEQQGLSQRELADRVGITQVSMSRYISGARIPKAPDLANIAKVLHTTSEYLLGQDMEDGDPETEYYRTQRTIARNAKSWSKKQKADLVNALFEYDS